MCRLRRPGRHGLKGTRGLQDGGVQPLKHSHQSGVSLWTLDVLQDPQKMLIQDLLAVVKGLGGFHEPQAILEQGNVTGALP